MSEKSFRAVLGDTVFPETPEDRRDIFTRVAAFYTEAYDMAGTHPNSVLWPSKMGQKQRFKNLCRIFGPEAQRTPVSVNDFGCGYGALFRYLDRKWFLKLGAYYGYDICGAFLEDARKTYSDDRAQFIQSDHVQREADYTFCSGTFGLKFDFDDAEWNRIVKEQLKAAAAKTRRGLAFNMVDTECPERDGTLYRADAADYEIFCREELSADVEVIRAGVFYEWTMLVRFEEPT